MRLFLWTLIMIGSRLPSSMAAGITLLYDDGHNQELPYGICTSNPLHNEHLSSIKFEAVSACNLYDDSECQSVPETTLEPIMFNSGTEIKRGGDGSNEFTSNFIICMGD
ncbi:uncharacterized protein BX664DRAFT_370745 [Halteromyces radiatus]|uniref:uncharacterized protein n=1 Tax=Halteromyces radiatus TaxID=101107 RepID=UPI0022205419|nr:uncharacterized protein BX664DRAFT_370745 [Halteromyces radiatus]KAI8097140.1 hypothetical protein BX664DRAFT_370745 [Halteromyces radiatus]